MNITIITDKGDILTNIECIYSDEIYVCAATHEYDQDTFYSIYTPETIEEEVQVMEYIHAQIYQANFNNKQNVLINLYNFGKSGDN